MTLKNFKIYLKIYIIIKYITAGIKIKADNWTFVKFGKIDFKFKLNLILKNDKSVEK